MKESRYLGLPLYTPPPHARGHRVYARDHWNSTARLVCPAYNAGTPTHSAQGLRVLGASQHRIQWIYIRCFQAVFLLDANLFGKILFLSNY